MNSRLTSLLLSALMVLFLASYSIYTGVRYFYSPYQTETAYSYTVADNYRAKAIAIREEKLLSRRTDDPGILSYTKSDGAVVIKGSVIAQVFPDEEQLHYQLLMNQLNNEISLLKEAQGTAKQFLGADTLRAQVNESVGGIVDATVRNNLKDIYASRDKLQLMLGKYRISTGRDKSYAERISYLEQEKQHLSSQLLNTYQDISISENGYFCSMVDGYEALLTPDFEALSTEDYRRAINNMLKPNSVNAIGKVQVGHDWYLALVIDKNDTQRFIPGTPVSLNLNLEDCNNIPASIYRVIPDETGNAVVILKTNYINETLMKLRHATVEIRFKSYTGLRISTDALRYEGLTEGVYVKNGNLIIFKAVQRIYTGDNFVLCTSAPRNEEDAIITNPLNQFDEVIVKGTDLYDGKII